MVKNKISNDEITYELMYGVEGEGALDEQSTLLIREAIKEFDNGSKDGKECRKMIAHTILECYQKVEDEGVRVAFRQLHKKYMNGNRDRISEIEEKTYVEFMDFLREEK